MQKSPSKISIFLFMIEMFANLISQANKIEPKIVTKKKLIVATKANIAMWKELLRKLRWVNVESWSKIDTLQK